jgi:hypothetical protein
VTATPTRALGDGLPEPGPKRPDLRAPFPYFGGKMRAAHLVWERFGDVSNYVEPFFGSGAVLLARPHAPGIETVNDADAYLANFWRAVQHDPDEVARWADWPANENDLHARHCWLVNEGRERVERLTTDPEYYDVKVAGWWVWGLCLWIGSGWCRDLRAKRPHLGNAGRGVHRQLPHLGNAGQGVHRQLPHLGDAGRGVCQVWREHLIGYMRALADRLRRARVCCGDWTRVLGPTPTVKQGLTGVFLDPPYAQDERHAALYTVETNVSTAVREWAIAHGDDPRLRIALCSYGEEPCPVRWERVSWKAKGGYGNQGNERGRENAHRETIDFSPNCLRPGRLMTLFDWIGEEHP